MSEKQLEKLYYSIYPMNQCKTQSKTYEETKELCETLEKEMISLMSPDLQAMFEDYKEYALNLKQTEQREAYIDGLEKRKCTVNEQDITALIFSQKHLEALYLQCLMHRRNAMQEIPELKGLSETCNRIYKLQDVDVLFQCLLMDQMDWEEEKLYVQFSTIYLLKQTVKN